MEINTENRRKEDVPDFRETMGGKSVCGNARGWKNPVDKKDTNPCGCMTCSFSSSFSEGMYGCADMGMLPAGELSEERDFRMLQGMYPNEAKELLGLVEEECDRLEYEGSPMFDEYPDYTTIYTLQKRVADAACKKTDAAQKKSETKHGGAGTGTEAEDGDAGGCTVPEDLIRVMLLQEMHRRRSRYRACRGVNAL